MAYTDDIANYKHLLETCLPKMAIVVATKDNKRYLVSQSPETIRVFNDEYSYYKYSTQEYIFECYELRFGVIMHVDVRDITFIEFTGVPNEVPPPIYINEKFKEYLTDETLRKLQYNFLSNVKSQRDAGCYDINNQYDEERMIQLEAFRYVLLNNYKISFDIHPIFNIFRDEHFYRFHLYSNYVDGDRLLHLRYKLTYSALILACNKCSEQLTEQQMLDIIETDVAYSGDLKGKWISKLNDVRDKHISNLTTERKESNDTLLSTLLKSRIIFQDVVNISEHRLAVWDKNIKDFCNTLGDESFSINLHADIIRSFVSDMFTDKEEYDREQYTQTILQKLYEQVSPLILLISQYDLLIKEAQELDFVKELEDITEYELFLRYWPRYIDIEEQLYVDVRPFTHYEWIIIKELNSVGVQVNEITKNKLHKGINLIELFEDKIDLLKEKKLKQIMSVARERADEATVAMKPVYNTLSDEEKQIFNDMVNDILNEDAYKKEVYELQRLVDVITFWPVALHPTPEYILKV